MSSSEHLIARRLGRTPFVVQAAGTAQLLAGNTQCYLMEKSELGLLAPGMAL